MADSLTTIVMKILSTVFSVLFALNFVSCAHSGKNYPKETVISTGEEFSFKNKHGKFIIRHVSETKRELVVNGKHHVINASARKERFNGLLGIVKSGRGFLGKDLPTAYVEGERHFQNRSEAIDKLYEGSDLFDWQCGRHGVIGGLYISPSGQIDVRLFKYFINGELAENLCSNL